MKRVWGMALLAAVGVWFLVGPPQVQAQSCKDEASMLDGSKQALLEVTAAVRKESLPDFERGNEQKSVVNKLGIHTSMLQELMDCLDKVQQDTSASKADVEAAKAQRDASAKLLEKIQHQEGDIKDAKESKNAKALIEKLDLTT